MEVALALALLLKPDLTACQREGEAISLSFLVSWKILHKFPINFGQLKGGSIFDTTLFTKQL